jgi:Zn-dependent peptidase ImmA (M78 family)
MTIPTRCKVNGRTITIKMQSRDKMPGAAGLFQTDKSLIWVAKGQELQEQQDTVVHELFHALLHTQGREYGEEQEELYVRALATGLIGLIQDNPELVQWLTLKEAQ